MTEYIDKQIILDKCQRLIDVERKQGSDVMNYGRERVNQTEVIMEYIEYMTPTADVIERSKIDKAIEEINELPTRGSVGLDGTISRNEVLKILKRNIGEENNGQINKR